VSDDTATTLEQEVHRLFELLDSMDIRGISAMLTDDAQGIDEISRRWMRGKAALDAYFAQLEGTVSEPKSQVSDLHATSWGEVGLVTFVLDQTYKMNGEEHRISAPTSIVFNRDNSGWKVAMIHTVPLPE
jgi:ketosteroid isomerase-like protein